MKNFLFIILSVMLVLTISCSDNDQVEREDINSLQEKYDKLILDNLDLLIDLDRTEEFLSRLRKNPDFFLLVLDAELEATEKGEDTYGSFTDFFVPTIHDALEAGVSKQEIQERINRLVKLAESGKFISSYEYGIFEKHGVIAISNYIQSTLEFWDSQSTFE